MTANTIRPAQVSARKERGALIFGLMLTFLCGAAVVSQVHDYRHMAAVGKVVEGRMTGGYRRVETRRNGAVVSVLNHPTFSYRTEDGKEVVATVDDSLDRSDIQPDRKMLLRYDPENPTSARLAAAVEAGPGFMVWVVGAFTLLLGGLSVHGLIGRHAKSRR
jgi:hypothetical protein